MQYRKKPVIIEAVQYNGDNDEEIIEFTGGQAKSMRIPFSPSAPDRERFPETMIIPTLEGDHRASKGDWIIKGVKGEFYPCKPDIFEATYSPEATTFNERLLNEKTDLNEKRRKLYDFMGSPAFRKIEPVQQSLLPVQFAAMVTYEECLTQRIMWLEKSETKTEPIAGSNGIQAEPDEDLNQVTVQGEIHIGDPL